MEISLLMTAALLGLGGIPHCAAMCSAPCMAVVDACRDSRAGTAASLWAWHAARVASYAVAGAVVAASVSALSTLGGGMTFLRPVWGLLHASVVALGVWLVWQGRWPAWFERAAQRAGQAAGVGHAATAGGTTGGGVVAVRWHGQGTGLSGPSRSAAAGSLWALMPCGLLQSALLVAALASGPVSAAAVMGTFALTSAVGPWLAPAVLLRLRGSAASPAWATRVAGATLILASGWSLAHGVWQQVVDLCT